MEDETTVTLDDGALDIERIQAAIRARIERRKSGALHVGDHDRDELLDARLAPLDDWNLPRDVWEAMWPPNLKPWNLDEDFPISSHRPGVAALLVTMKRLQRRAVELIARPFLVRQAEINRTLSLIVRTLADENAHERLRVDALEQRLLRVGQVVRELRGDESPLVVFPAAKGDAQGDAQGDTGCGAETDAEQR